MNFDLGFISNVIAVPILLSKEMSNVFNRMLSALSVVDSVFIVCSILEAIRKHIGTLLKCVSLYVHFITQLQVQFHRPMFSLSCRKHKSTSIPFWIFSLPVSQHGIMCVNLYHSCTCPGEI